MLFFGFADEDVYVNIRTLLKAAVKKRMMAHRRIGCMLSGKAMTHQTRCDALASFV